MVNSNRDRIEWAELALVAWRAAKGQAVSDESDARDLIADVLHLLVDEGRDVTAELRMAHQNFEEEISENC